MMFKSLKVLTVLSTVLFSQHSFANFTQTGTASYYGVGDGFHGRKTASGQRYNAYGLSMAHRSIKNGSRVKVTNLHNGRSVVVVKNDYGPAARTRRIVDLSYGAKQALHMGGLAKVRLEVLD